jgi:heme-degrading monooxygenase HmoA
MFVAVNEIKAPASQHQRMAEAFERHAPGLKQFPGFLSFELWFSENDTVLAVSRWESREAFEGYANSEMFKSHHGGASREQAGSASQVFYYTGKKLL